MSHREDQRRDLRIRLAAAAITGLFAGAIRATVDWLLRQLSSTG